MTPIASPLRAAAAAAALLLAACAPPAAPAGPDPRCPPLAAGTLVDLAEADPSLVLDVRYATPGNFTGAPLPGYEAPRALLRPRAAAALGRVQRALRAEGLGLKVFDAYRPVRATRAMVDWAERSGNAWVLEQGYVARESGHNRGGTVDLTLVRLDTGEELEMGTPYDTFSGAAHTENASGEVLANRLRLRRAMEAEGFRNFEKEWWHYGIPGEDEPLDVPLGCVR